MKAIYEENPDPEGEVIKIVNEYYGNVQEW
jgi:hypothetical protein